LFHAIVKMLGREDKKEIIARLQLLNNIDFLQINLMKYI